MYELRAFLESFLPWKGLEKGGIRSTGEVQ